jgi:LPS-assembly protein
VRAAAPIACLIAAAGARAGDMCPAPPHHNARSAAEIAADDHLIHVESDGLTVDADGLAVLTGRVVLRQDERSAGADSFTYHKDTGQITVAGHVDFEDPLVRLKSDAGSYEQDGGGEFNHAEFELLDRRGRGTAGEIAVQPGGRISLDQVRYTTCPVGNQDWMLQASSITLDTVKQVGVARHAWMQFKGVPILYTPYLSFPLGDQRKSGFLIPVLDHSGTNGYEIGVAYYFNLAPNYDLTLTPEILSSRGVELGAEFRFLTSNSHGQVEGTYLPHDLQTNTERGYFHVTDTTDFKSGLRGEIDIASVSDNSYFEDFGVGSEQTSVTYLERRADLKYQDDHWRIEGELQNFETIDITVPALAYPGLDDRPYSRVPRVNAEGLFPLGASNFEFIVDSEAVNFLRDVGPSGVRLDVSPEFRWSNRAAGYFFEPAVGWHLTQYSLEDATPGGSASPFRSVPYGRFDSGLIFERDAGSAGQRTQTFEPRLVYSYVPYRNQDGLPVFDSALPDLNLSELFRTNRYVGDDRIGDANQLSMAVTTRLFDQASGSQYLSATLGQIRYFQVPRVNLPCQYQAAVSQNSPTATALAAAYAGAGVLGSALPGGPLPGTLPGELPGVAAAGPAATSATTAGVVYTCLAPAEQFNASDLVGNVSVTAYKNWSINLDYVWNPYINQTQKSEVALQYRPDSSHVINIAYRYQHETFKEWDGSFAWPLASHWNAVGRLVYSIIDHQTIEQVAGVEYKSCCWRIQLVERRYVDNRPGEAPSLNQSIALQLELIGLGSVGKTSNSFLERSISGYSAVDQAP